MKNYKALIGILLFLILFPSPENPEQRQSYNLQLTTSLPAAYATIYSEEGERILSTYLPSTATLPVGVYTIRVWVIGYQEEAATVDLRASSQTLHFDMTPDPDWHHLLNLDGLVMRVVDFVSVNGHYTVLFETVDEKQRDAYRYGEIDQITINHYTFSFTDAGTAELQQQPDASFGGLFTIRDLPPTAQIWNASAFGYQIVSPHGDYAVIPFHHDELNAELHLLEIETGREIALGIPIVAPTIPWHDNLIFWSDDESRLLLDSVYAGEGPRESYLVDIEHASFNAEVTPLSPYFRDIGIGIRSVAISAASPDLEHILLTGVTDQLHHMVIELDDMKIVVAPIDNRVLHGITWLTSGNPGVVTFDGLIEYKYPLFEEQIHLPPAIVPISTVTRMYITPDLEYILAWRDDRFGAALLAYRLANWTE